MTPLTEDFPMTARLSLLSAFLLSALLVGMIVTVNAGAQEAAATQPCLPCPQTELPALIATPEVSESPAPETASETVHDTEVSEALEAARQVLHKTSLALASTE